MHKHLCVRGSNNLVFATAKEYLSICFACIPAEKRSVYGCFFRSWILNAALFCSSVAIPLEGENCYLCFFLSFMSTGTGHG